MLFTILGFLTGLAGPITALAGKIIDLKAAKATAASDTEKAEIDREIQEAHDRRAILIAESGNRLASIINVSMRTLIAIGPALFLLKVFLWDKVIGALNGCVGQTGTECNLFNTDSLDVNLWYVVMGVIAFYFAYDIAAIMRRK